MNDYVTQSDILKMGFTKGAIARFLGEPDKLAPNPHSRKKPPMKLFLRDRVLEAIHTEEWQTWAAATRDRRQKASDRMKSKMDESRQQNINAWLNRVQVEFPDCTSRAEALALAETYWEYRKAQEMERHGQFEALDRLETLGPSLDHEDHRRRWMDNMIRHEFSNYDKLLDQAVGLVGREEIRAELQLNISQRVGKWLTSLDD